MDALWRLPLGLVAALLASVLGGAAHGALFSFYPIWLVRVVLGLFLSAVVGMLASQALSRGRLRLPFIGILLAALLGGVALYASLNAQILLAVKKPVFTVVRPEVLWTLFTLPRSVSAADIVVLVRWAEALTIMGFAASFARIDLVLSYCGRCNRSFAVSHSARILDASPETLRKRLVDEDTEWLSAVQLASDSSTVWVRIDLAVCSLCKKTVTLTATNVSRKIGWDREPGYRQRTALKNLAVSPDFAVALEDLMARANPPV